MSYKRDVEDGRDFWRDQQAKAAEAEEYERTARPPMLRAKLRKLLAETLEAQKGSDSGKIRDLQLQVLSVRRELKKYTQNP